MWLGYGFAGRTLFGEKTMTKAQSDLTTYRGIQWQDLHPIARMPFQDLTETLTKAFTGKATRTWFRPHMGYRGPAVQDALYAHGRTKPGAQVTKAQGWESAHQFGLAVDFVPWIGGSIPREKADGTPIGGDEPKGYWLWDDTADWKFLKSRAEMHGLLCPIAWDRPHVEHPAWDVIRRRIRGG